MDKIKLENELIDIEANTTMIEDSLAYIKLNTKPEVVELKKALIKTLRAIEELNDCYEAFSCEIDVCRICLESRYDAKIAIYTDIDEYLLGNKFAKLINDILEEYEFAKAKP